MKVKDRSKTSEQANRQTGSVGSGSGEKRGDRDGRRAEREREIEMRKGKTNTKIEKLIRRRLKYRVR